jgi:hypothetical protein
MRPDRINGTRLCIYINSDGVTVYGNKQAFLSLASYMRWIAESDPAEHFELHTVMSLTSEICHFSKESQKNVFVINDCDTVVEENEDFVWNEEGLDRVGFELTFMIVEEKDLDDLLVKYLRNNGCPSTDAGGA